VPGVPRISQALSAAAGGNGKSLGTVNLTIDGQHLPPLLAEAKTLDEIIRRAAMKFGKSF
jgi:hypothetical protein